MPINYELEKEIFFKNHNVKIGDVIIIPQASYTEWTITDICPKYLKIQRETELYGIVKRTAYYTTNNKLKNDMRLYKKNNEE